MTEPVRTIGALLANLATSVVLLLSVFAGLAAAERISSRWQKRKRNRRHEQLREAGIRNSDFEKLQPLVEYVTKHHSAVKPIISALATASLVLLMTRASNTTGLQFSYGSMALVFAGLTIVETVRYRRARTIHHKLNTAPAALASTNIYDEFEFLNQSKTFTLGPDG